MKFRSFLRYLDLRWFRGLKVRPTRPIQNHLPPLQLETLEERTVPSTVPTIIKTLTTPADGSSVATATPVIQVVFSEQMNATVPSDPNSANDPNNYLLFGSAGNSIPINSVTLNGPDSSGHESATLTYNGGAGLILDTYTLFVRGDHLTEAVDGQNLPLAEPGQYVVANGGASNVSVINMPGTGTLGSISGYNLPGIGATVATPIAEAAGVLTGTGGLPDLAVVDSANNQVDIFAGQPVSSGGGFYLNPNQTPNLVLTLPTGSANARNSITLGDFNNDGNLDIAVANAGTNNVTVFLNTTSAGNLSFAPGVEFDGGSLLHSPTAIVAGDFDGATDASGAKIVDLAVVNSAVDAADNYNLTILPGNGSGSFGAGTQIALGNSTAATGVLSPTSLAFGHFAPNAGNLPDLVGAGTNGATYLLNNTTGIGNFSFNRNHFTSTTWTNVAVGVVRGSNGSNLDDIVGLDSVNNQVDIWQNAGSTTIGVASFTFMSTPSFGSTLTGLTLARLSPPVPGQNNLDILVTQKNNAGVLTVLQNNSSIGTTTFGAPVNYTVDNNPVAVIAADFNGATDAGNNPLEQVVTLNNTNADFTLLQGAGDGTLETAGNILLKPTTAAIGVGDLNGDGISDLVIAQNTNGGFHSNGSASITVMLGQLSNGVVTYGANSFTYTPANSGLSVTGIVSIAVGDIYGGKFNDIVVAANDQNGNPVVDVLKNNLSSSSATLGAGSFTPESTISLGNTSTPEQLVLADFNGATDGSGNPILDIAVATQGNGGFHGGNPGGVSVLIGNGNGTFANPVQYDSRNTAVAIAVADFNNDGNLDFVVANTSGGFGTGNYAVYYGDGTGGFNNPGGRQNLGISNPVSIAVGSLTGNGFNDIIVASSSTGATSGGVAVLLNQLGTGFGTPIVTSVLPGTALQSVVVAHVNQDSFPDLIVTTQQPGFGGGSTTDNIFTLMGNGDGTFQRVVPYIAGGTTSPTVATSYGALVSDPFLRVTTFHSGGTTVEPNLIANGTFSIPDLNGVKGNLNGWSQYEEKTTPGSYGIWSVQTGATSPVSGTSVTPPSAFQAMLDQANLAPIRNGNNPNTAADYQGSTALYQNIAIPNGADSVTLSLTLSLYNFGSDTSTTNTQGWSDNTTFGPQPLDFHSGINQQVRVDIMDPRNPASISDATESNFLGIDSTHGLLGNIFLTTSGDVFTNPVNITVAADGTISVNGMVRGTLDLKQFAGRTIMLRIATTNNQGQLLVGVQDVQLDVLFPDTTPPVISNLALRNPGFTDSSDAPLANGTLPQHSTDPTIVGRVSDIGGLNTPAGFKQGNIAYIEFDLNNDSFSGASGDVVQKITNWDALGNFTFTVPTPAPGLNTIDVAAVDGAGNVSAIIPFTFFYQGPSLTDWQANGPSAINVVGEPGVNYTTVSGYVTGVALDSSDPSGNTFYVGSDNGGVWKTTDGGNDYTPLTDFITNAQGQPISVPVGALAVANGVNPRTGLKVNAVYVGTGVGNDNLDSRPGFGVLLSTDGGKTWNIDGNSGSVLAGATITSITVDNNDPNLVYVAVASGGAQGVGVYKTTNALDFVNATWTNVTVGSNMVLPNNTNLGAGASLFSVTDLIEDPTNSQRLFIGIGNIGLTPGATINSEGVWKSINGGQTWQLEVGGLPVAGIGVPPKSTLPSGFGGNSLGRITVAMGTGRPGDESTVYVLIGTPPTSFTAPFFNYGSEFQGANGSGLYYSSTDLNDVTEVMLNVNIGGGMGTQNYQPINLLGDNASNAGALLVDPTDPMVVYVGGSTRGATNLPQERQSFIRVDVGNIDGYSTASFPPAGVTNTGDDATKFQQGFFGNAGGLSYYDGITATNPYKGEGVYWYNLAGATSGGSGNVQLLPPDITSLTFDAQGRLLIGTDSGVWRGVSQGYGYDFTSGGQGIVRTGKGQNGFSAPGMTLTALNGNLQITDLTSVAIDPSTRNVLYTTQFFTGTAGSAGILQWSSEGVTGPTVNGANQGINNAGSVLLATPASGASANTANTLFRVWEYANANALVPERSTDNGVTFNTLSSNGLLTSGVSAGTFPTFVIDPTPLLLNGTLESVLLVGTNPLQITFTSGNVWDTISPNPNIAPGGSITAAAISPTNPRNVLFVGTNQGQVFITTSLGQDNWPESDTGLPAAPVTSITIDPTNDQTAFITFGNGGVNNRHVYMTLNAGSGAATVWTPIGTNTGLPNVSVNSLVIVPITINGQTTDDLYVATDVGVYVSTNLGQSSARVGAGMPNVPVVNLQYNATFGTLAAATQGRGVFTLSTNKLGAHVVGIANGSASTTISSIDVTFNEPINPTTFTPGSIQVTGPTGLVIPVTGINNLDAGVDQEFQLTFAPQTANGFYNVTFGPNVIDQTGNAMDQNQNGVNSENPGDIYTGRVYFFTGTNSAPVLGNTSATFPAVGEDGLGTNTGTVVLGSWVTSTLAITDSNPNLQARQGIAITAIDDSKGTWQYSQNGGTTWTNIPTTVSETHALLLQASANNLLRYLPGPSYDSVAVPPSGVVGNASFAYRAWDLTSGLDPATGADGTFADVSINGGSTAFSSAEGAAVVQVMYVNHGPTFTMQTGPLSALENAGLQTIANWTANPNAGAPNEAGQTLSYIATNTNNSLFAVQPSISANGTLTYQPASDANGSATVYVWLQDNGGTANGGQNTSVAHMFVINITPVNQAPSFTPGPNEATQVFSGLVVVNPWATNVSPGAANESSQTLTFLVSSDNPSLFVVQPSISINGTNGVLTYEVGSMVGTAHVTVLLQDNGGTANGGHNISAPVTFTITAEPVVSSGSADAVWVSALYRELLQREITPSEVSYWTTLLTGGMPRLAVATQITSSDEYYTVYTKNLFVNYLGRTAQMPDINYYLQQFHNGATPNQVKAQILSSGEYYTRNGGTNFGFVSGLYRDVLGVQQNQDPAGVAYWVMQMSLGVPRSTVAMDILSSPAANARVIQGAYQLMLNRAATSSDVAYWSGLPDNTLEADLANSAEYGIVTSAQNYNSQPDQNWLNHVFQDTLGRTIDSSGISYYILQIRAGVRYPDIVASILSSQEYRTDIATAAFSHILHRQPRTDEVSFYVNLLNEGQTFELIESEMYGSAEYYTVQGGGTNQGFLQALYRDALNRPLDQAGLDTWGAQLAAVPSLQAVAYAVLTSGEAESDLVAAAYARYLRRPDDNNGLLYWVGLLENGMTDVQFDAKLIGSPEYYTRFSS